MSLLSRFFHRAKAQDGNASVEFVIALPLFLLLFVSIFELGMAMTRQTMLEHGLDVAMREIRLGTGNQVTQADITDLVCDSATILKGCHSSLAVEMTTIDTDNWVMPDPVARCINRGDTAQPVVSWVNGRQSDVMFLRACYVTDPMFPAFGLGAMFTKDHTGGYFLVASSAFSQEPR